MIINTRIFDLKSLWLIVMMMMMMTQMQSVFSSLASSLTYSPYRAIRDSQDHVPSRSSSTRLCSCGSKHFLEATCPSCFPKDVSEIFYPYSPDWYKELVAWFSRTKMRPYEEEIADYKKKLFDNLTGKAEKILEIGIGTGPNLKYYASNKNVFVFGMDPIHKMEKPATDSAREAGLKPENFRFMQGVAEAIPLDDNSVDAVVATLVLCSVSDVTKTLDEIKRVLKPGGIFLFIEHVAAEEGSFFRYVQNLLDPYQQVVAGGCHLTRKTDLHILAAGFDGGIEINTAEIYSSCWKIRTHAYGIAYK